MSNLEIHRLIRELGGELQPDGYVFRTAEDAEAALELVRHHCPDRNFDITCASGRVLRVDGWTHHS